MRSSMRRRLLTLMCGQVVLVVFMAWLINSVFLERFYIYSKEHALMRAMSAINHLYGGDGSERELELAKIQVNQGMQIIIFNRNLEAIYVSWQDTVNLGFGRRGIRGGPDLLRFMNLESGSGYEISRNFDERLQAEYLDLVGALDQDLFVLIRTPLQTITDSVGIANRFLLFTGLFSVLVAFFISARISSGIASPIKAMEGIAKDMSRLDFTRRISVLTKDEIASLADSINALSDHLQGTIQELQQKNRQLEEDIQFISRLDEGRKEFLASVSHELKTPIALIRGYAEALEERVVTSDEDRDYYFHVISDEADRMNALVKKLMNLNNLELGQDELYLEDFDVVSLVQSVIRRGRSLPGAAALEFQLVSPPEVWVRADEFLIEEVVFNYMTNAIHYAAGRKLIRVTVGPAPEQTEAAVRAAGGEAAADESAAGVRTAGVDAATAQAQGERPGTDPAAGQTAGAGEPGAARRYRIEVFNSGSSLQDGERERVWESFYKVDKSRSREYGGSGLGLSVVRAAMARHQSACGVDNLEDGVNFWFELPAAIF